MGIDQTARMKYTAERSAYRSLRKSKKISVIIIEGHLPKRDMLEEIRIDNVCCASLLTVIGKRKSLIDDYLVRYVLETEFKN